MEIPLFPLHAVLCPGVVLPLHVFEERYRILVERCLDDGSGFGIVRIREGRDVGAPPAALERVGTIARLRRATRLPSGSYEVLVVGAERFGIHSVFEDRAPYLVASVTLLAEPLGDPRRIPDLVAGVGRGLVRLLDAVSPAGLDADADPEQIARRLAEVEDPTLLSHLVAGLVPIAPTARQVLLEAGTTEERLAELERVLARETVLLQHRLAAWQGDPRGEAARAN